MEYREITSTLTGGMEVPVGGMRVGSAVEVGGSGDGVAVATETLGGGRVEKFCEPDGVLPGAAQPARRANRAMAHKKRAAKAVLKPE